MSGGAAVSLAAREDWCGHASLGNSCGVITVLQEQQVENNGKVEQCTGWSSRTVTTRPDAMVLLLWE